MGVQGTSLEQVSIRKRSKAHRTYKTISLSDPKEARGTLVIKHHYMPEGNKFKNSMSWDVSFSFRATDIGAGKISGIQKPEYPSVGTSSNKSVQEQERRLEQEAQHKVQQEWKWKTKT